MNTLEMSNVVVGERAQKDLTRDGDKLEGVYEMIDPVVSRLASLNPLWIFEVEGYGSWGLGKKVAMLFRVKCDGEELGTIGTMHMRRGRVICISNDRIGKTRQRTDSYRTESAEKAVLMAKKMFGKMSPTERISKAKDAAERVVSRAGFSKTRECHNHMRVVQDAMLSWAETYGRDMFLKYIEQEATPTNSHKVVTSLERVAVLELEMRTIDRVQQEFGDNKTALVIKDSGKYLVKVGDKVDLYDDNSLPVDMRMKLGMLKLVQDEEYLTDIGCKVTSEIFVLLVDELTNVSEGE
jgi:hypothetical protein